MLSIRCALCRAELSEPGGLLLSPPDENQLVRKLHLCPGEDGCQKKVETYIAVQRMQMAKQEAKWGRCRQCGDQVTANLPGGFHLRSATVAGMDEPMEIKCGPVVVGES